MNLIYASLIVFSLTLIITKSRILGCKREFVQKRYKATTNPSFIHAWWLALWNCSMCSGFWVAIPVCYFFPNQGMIADVLMVFGLNWLLHCLENVLFQIGYEKSNSDSSLDVR